MFLLRNELRDEFADFVGSEMAVFLRLVLDNLDKMILRLVKCVIAIRTEKIGWTHCLRFENTYVCIGQVNSLVSFSIQ